MSGQEDEFILTRPELDEILQDERNKSATLVFNRFLENQFLMIENFCDDLWTPSMDKKEFLGSVFNYFLKKYEGKYGQEQQKPEEISQEHDKKGHETP